MTTLHLLPDAPITSPSFDRLDRMSFVRSFAEAIRAAQGTDSVVLALAGPWGSGKSSLINLITGELQRDEAGAPLIVKFNPWWFSESGKLVVAFLEQLAAAVCRPEVRDQLGNASEPLRHLAEVLSAPGTTWDTSSAAERDVERLRESVNAVLARSPRRILVFMDDIDRLTPDEMAQLLLIVRAVATFPNTTYVLAFDHEVVSEAITNKLGVDGRTYLEKVVQLQIDVPIPGRMTLQRMVIGQLEAIDPSSNALDPEGQTYFRVLFNQGVKHFLTTPRACTRLLNVMRFTYPTLTGQVYFPDMLGIACLMAFASQAIQAIRSNQDAFVGHCDPTGKDWIQIRRFHKEWLAELPKQDRPAVESIVRLLFPRVAWALHGPLMGEEYLEQWDEQRRICSPRHFEAYFRLGLSAGEAAEYQWHNLIELLDDATAFARSLQRFGPLEDGQGESWIEDLLKQTSDFLQEKATSEQAGKIFHALMKRGDQLAAVDYRYVQSWNIGPFHALVALLVDCLAKIEGVAQRRALLHASVRAEGGLLTVAEFLDALQYRLDVIAEEGTAPDDDSNRTLLKKLIREFDARLQTACEDGTLEQHPRYLKILQKWRIFGRRNYPRKWLQQVCQSDRKLVATLSQLWPPPAAADDAASFPTKFIAAMFGKDELIERLAKIDLRQPEWLTAHDEKMLEKLMDALKEAS